MKATIWGCRGSLATPGPETVRYGGNTSCVEVRPDDGTAIVLDAGTGIRPLGGALARDGVAEVHVLLSHLHMDHIQGLGFFAPLFQEGVDVHIWGPPSPVEPLAERIAMYLSPPLFPVHLRDIPSTVAFHDAPDETVTIGGARVRAGPVAHQGATVGWRIEADDTSLVYLPDHEPGLGVDLAALDPSWISGCELAEGADVLLHDAQYLDDEYPAKVGWGHSSLSQVLEFARKSGAAEVVLFHHDPVHDDDMLDAVGQMAVEALADRPVRVAREGMVIVPAAARAP